MQNSLYLDAVKTAKLADEIQAKNPKMSRIDAVKQAKLQKNQSLKGKIDCIYGESSVRELLNEKKKELELIAKELLKKEVIFEADLTRLIGKRPFGDTTKTMAKKAAKSTNGLKGAKTKKSKTTKTGKA